MWCFHPFSQPPTTPPFAYEFFNPCFHPFSQPPTTPRFAYGTHNVSNTNPSPVVQSTRIRNKWGRLIVWLSLTTLPWFVRHLKMPPYICLKLIARLRWDQVWHFYGPQTAPLGFAEIFPSQTILEVLRRSPWKISNKLREISKGDLYFPLPHPEA